MAVFTFTNVAIALTTLYIARRLYWETTTGSRQRAYASKNNCLAPRKRVNTILPSWFPLASLDYILSMHRDHKRHTMLESWTRGLRGLNTHTNELSIFGLKVFMTDDPENVKTMLATGFENWSLGKERIDQMSSFLGSGIFTNEGKAWKHSREMLRPCFEKSAVADVSLFDKHVTRLVALLPMDGTEVDLQPFFHELTLDIATEFLFGKSTNSLDRGDDTKDVQKFIEAFEYCENPLENKNYKRFGYIGLLLPDGDRKKAIETIQNFTDKIIDEEITSRATSHVKPSPRYIFLDELLVATQDRTVIRSELLNILLAGRDTTAALLSNVLWELPRHPSMLSRLRAEISEFIGDSEVPSYEQLKDMKYLRAIINESQRLYPIVPSNSRQALHDTILPRGAGPQDANPVFVPEGAYVAYHVYAMHRRQDIYGADADTFNPERWLVPSFRPGWAYIPFSGGPRVCIGQNFALTEAMFVIVRLVQGCEIEQKDWEPWREKLTLTCTGLGGCKVGLRKRVA